MNAGRRTEHAESRKGLHRTETELSERERDQVAVLSSPRQSTASEELNWRSGWWCGLQEGMFLCYSLTYLVQPIITTACSIVGACSVS